MKKNVSFVSVILVLIMIFSAAVPALALDTEKYVVREITAYLFNAARTKSVTCLFDPDLPEVPNIDIMDYLSITQTMPREQIKNDDGTYWVYYEYAAIFINTEEDFLIIYNAEYAFLDSFYEGAYLSKSFLSAKTSYMAKEPSPLYLDLSSYGIDIFEKDGKLYFPFSVLNDIINHTYNVAEYVDGKLYFTPTMDDHEENVYFDRSSVYNNLERSKALAEFTYNEFCFQIENFYGRPSRSEVAAVITEKGLDLALDEISDETRLAKELLKSTSLVDYYIGMCILSKYFSDGGHTVLYNDPIRMASYYNESEFAKIWNANFGKSDEEKWQLAHKAYLASLSTVYKMSYIEDTKARQCAAYEPVKEWDGIASLTVCGNTAVFSFDEFSGSMIEPFKWSLDYAKENGIKNFVIDISTNGGGLTTVVAYIVGMITNRITKSATYDERFYFRNTDNLLHTVYDLDLNLDGEFNEKDSEVIYDFNFAILTSVYSFSCANLLPVTAQEHGVMILGQTSGGGTCGVTKMYTPAASYYFMSNNVKFLRLNGEDTDSGATVDVDLTTPYTGGTDLAHVGIDDVEAAGLRDYDRLYDYEALGALIEEFYTRGDVNEDGEINNKDVVALFAYVSAAQSPEYDHIYDINCDGMVNNRDIVQLFRNVSTIA